MNYAFIAFIIAVAAAYMTTPYVIKLANRVGAIDVPKDERRVHKVPTPRLGGIAIFTGFIAAFAVVAVGFAAEAETGLLLKMAGVLIGALIMVITGYFDDIKPLSAKRKFLIQIAAALIVMAFGVRIEWLTNPLYLFNGGSPLFSLGMLSYPLTLIWIVGVTNAINLIDGLDGLAAGVSTISALTLFAVALVNAQYEMATLALVLAGATMGFLPHNFNPAKIFMGDSGALFLGYMLSVISIMGVLKSAAALSILVPVFAMGIPIFDTFFAMLRRILSGRSIAEADKGHLHHRLLEAGLSQKQAVLTLYSVSAVLGFSAVALMEATLKVALAVVFAVFLLASMGVKYLGLMDVKPNNKMDA
ncbi:MAG: MraY family glycosyltransferase [Bacillota bacterium]